MINHVTWILSTFHMFIRHLENSTPARVRYGINSRAADVRATVTGLLWTRTLTRTTRVPSHEPLRKYPWKQGKFTSFRCTMKIACEQAPGSTKASEKKKFGERTEWSGARGGGASSVLAGSLFCQLMSKIEQPPSQIFNLLSLSLH